MERQFPQLRGQFLIDRDGIVRWRSIEASRGLEGIGRSPTAEEMLAAVLGKPQPSARMIKSRIKGGWKEVPCPQGNPRPLCLPVILTLRRIPRALKGKASGWLPWNGGIVSLLHETNRETAGRFLGTLRYAAPEQLTGKKPTPKTDIYAAALVLFEMVAGRGPFDEYGDSNKIAAAHLNLPLEGVAAWRRASASRRHRAKRS